MVSDAAIGTAGSGHAAPLGLVHRVINGFDRSVHLIRKEWYHRRRRMAVIRVHTEQFNIRSSKARTTAESRRRGHHGRRTDRLWNHCVLDHGIFNVTDALDGALKRKHCARVKNKVLKFAATPVEGSAREVLKSFLVRSRFVDCSRFVESLWSCQEAQDRTGQVTGHGGAIGVRQGFHDGTRTGSGGITT